MRESALQIPDLIQTAIGGKRMARSPRKISLEHIVSLYTESLKSSFIGIKDFVYTG